MSMYYRYLLLLILNLSILIYNTQAQQVKVKRSSVIENYKGKPFYIHIVGLGETIEGIAKAYSVSTDEIISENPIVSKGLKEDLVLRIPVKNNVEAPEPEVESDVEEVDRIETVQPKSDYKPGYTLYTVKKQETLYGIAKQNNITMDDLLKANPGLEVLKNGMEIKIPVEISVTSTVAKPESSKPNLIVSKIEEVPFEIEVKSGETLYSICKFYGLSVDDVIDLNPQLSGGLKPGMVLKLRADKGQVEPSISKESVKQVVPSYLVECYNSENLSKTYHIALLLPFALDDASTALDATDENDPLAFESFNYFQFYAGFLLAADSLQKFGLKAKIEVLDADKLNDTLTIRQILRKPGMDKMNLIVGPMYAPSFNIAARFAKKHKIGIVNPLSKRENIVEDNPFVIKAQVSAQGVASKLSSFIVDNYPNANVIAVVNDKKEMKNIADLFAAQLNENLASKAFRGTFQESVFSTGSIGGVSKKIKSGVQNIVILFSGNKIAVPNFVSSLNPSAKSNEIILIGMEGWEELGLETEFLVNLNFHQVSSSYIDYESEEVKSFSAKFRNKYGAEPLTSRFAFLGYDLGWHFLTSLMWNGDNYLLCLPNNTGNGLEYRFKFSSEKSGCGLCNTHIEILKLQNYKMVPVN